MRICLLTDGFLDGLGLKFDLNNTEVQLYQFTLNCHMVLYFAV